MLIFFVLLLVLFFLSFILSCEKTEEISEEERISFCADNEDIKIYFLKSEENIKR